MQSVYYLVTVTEIEVVNGLVYCFNPTSGAVTFFFFQFLPFLNGTICCVLADDVNQQ